MSRRRLGFYEEPRRPLIGWPIALLVVAITLGMMVEYLCWPQAADRRVASPQSVETAAPKTETLPDLNANEWDKLEELVKTHPAPEINRGLHTNIALEEILVAKDQTKPPPCVFTAAPLPDGTWQKAIVFKDDFFNRTYDDRLLQLGLYHEYQHYKQFLSNPGAKAMFLELRAGHLGREAARLFYENEVEATLAECELAKRQSWQTLLPIYADYEKGGPGVIRQMVAKTVATMPLMTPFAGEILLWGAMPVDQ
ncbi:MAG: hypothetical protein HY461_00415 [Parcubacteria group bacterium]|nr:hypothetical protein [Parcubacteria group bacterium]